MSATTANQRMPKFRCNICLVAMNMFEPPTTGLNANRVPGAKQFFTSCSHLMCSNCRIRIGGQSCAVCNRNCNFMGCTSSMPKHYQVFFQPAANAKKLFTNPLHFQRTQHLMLKRRFTAKLQHRDKKRTAMMKKAKEANEQRQRTAEKLCKYKIMHHIICQEKRRRAEEKQRRHQLLQQQKQQQQPHQHHHHHHHRRNEIERGQQHSQASHSHQHHSHDNFEQHRNPPNTFITISSTSSNSAPFTVDTFGSFQS